MEKICVIGAGSWGTAIANLLSTNNENVFLYHYKSSFLKELAKNLSHPYIPALKLSEKLNFTSQAHILADSRYVFFAIPTSSIRKFLSEHVLDKNSNVVSLAKGIENEHFLFPSQIINQCSDIPLNNITVLSGPSHAEEVAANIPTAVVAAGANITLNRKVQKLLSSSTFRVYSNSDSLGVEISGALKNVISIASGMCIGLGFGDNTTAALITRGLNEIVRLGVALGADESTFYGLAGIGDLAVTAFSKYSRNRNFGIKIGQGQSPKKIINDSDMIIEGYYTVKSLSEVIIKNKIQMPISSSVYKILYEDLSPKDAIMELMSRDLTHENN